MQQIIRQGPDGIQLGLFGSFAVGMPMALKLGS